MIFTAVPYAKGEYVWNLGRFTGHVWRHHQGGWGATIRGFKTFGVGRTRREAIATAIHKAYRSQPIVQSAL